MSSVALPPRPGPGARPTVPASGQPRAMRLLFAAVIVSTILLLASCSGHPEGVPLEEDLHLAAQIAELRRTGGTRPLIELAPGTWDTVYIGRDPLNRDRVEKEVGQSIGMPSRITFGNILVFMNLDTVVRAVRIRPVQIHPGTSLVVKYTSALQLVAPCPGTIQVRPVEPGQPVPECRSADSA